MVRQCCRVYTIQKLGKYRSNDAAGKRLEGSFQQKKWSPTKNLLPQQNLRIVIGIPKKGSGGVNGLKYFQFKLNYSVVIDSYFITCTPYGCYCLHRTDVIVYTVRTLLLTRYGRYSGLVTDVIIDILRTF